MTNDLPPGWAETKVGNIGKVEYGKGLPKSQRVDTGPIEVYGSAGLAGHHDQALVVEPVVIVGRKGNAGAVWYTAGPSWPIDTTYFLRIPKGFSVKYLGLQLDHLDLVGHDSSTTLPSLRRPDLEAITVAVAPSAEQVRIAATIEEHFSRLDAAERSLRQALQQLHSLRLAVLIDAFHIHRELPPAWRASTIGNVADVQLGRQRSPRHHTGVQMRPYLRSANVTWDGISLNDVKEMNFDGADFKKYRLEPGDLLLNEASGSPNEVGKPAIWNGAIPDCCFQNTLLRLRPHGVTLDYLYWYCYASALSGRFGEAGRGVNIRHLGKRGLTQFPISVAPLDEQAEIVERLNRELEQAAASGRLIRAALTRVAVLRRAVLAEGFAGRLEPQDPTDEPASVLLDRIAESGPVKLPRQKISA